MADMYLNRIENNIYNFDLLMLHCKSLGHEICTIKSMNDIQYMLINVEMPDVETLI